MEREIEQLKAQMCQAYENKSGYAEILKISQELDQWLNAWNDLKLSEELSCIFNRKRNAANKSASA